VTNPIPGRITSEIWNFWLESKKIITGVRLGGIYAFKSGYHSSRDENEKYWPGNYSITLSYDKEGPSWAASAIDLTMSDGEMRKRTSYLQKAADTNDPRMSAVRSFYGTIDSRNVLGRIRRSNTGSFDKNTSDASHLWHIHISFFRKYSNNWTMLSRVLSVLKGENLTEYVDRTGDIDLIGLQEGNSGQGVKAVQALIRYTGRKINGELIEVDGKWGPVTSKFLLAVRHYVGSGVNSANVLTGWAFAQLVLAVIKYQAEKLFNSLFNKKKEELVKDVLAQVKSAPPSDQQVLNAVRDYVNQNKEILFRDAIQDYLTENKEKFQGPPGPVADEIIIRVKTEDVS